MGNLLDKTELPSVGELERRINLIPIVLNNVEKLQEYLKSLHRPQLATSLVYVSNQLSSDLQAYEAALVDPSDYKEADEVDVPEEKNH